MTPSDNFSRSAKLRAFTFCLSRSRFSIILLVVGLSLLLMDQGRDVLIAYAEDNKILKVAAASGFWAISIWGWSRLLLDVRYEDPPICISCYNFWRKWLPRILGALAFIVVAFSAYKSGQNELAVWTLASLLIFAFLVISRRTVYSRVASGLNRYESSATQMAAEFFITTEIDDVSPPPYENFWQMVGIPFDGKKFTGESWKLRALTTIAMLLVFLFFAVSGIFNPVWLGRTSGALILFFLWAVTWLPFGSWMSYVADRHGIPLLTFLVVLAVISSCFNDNHEIRRAENGVQVSSRPTVTEGLDSWAAANTISDKKVSPFIIVATAGGGSRAAYWTATLLGEVHDNAPVFPRQTFAISGVSGGSVGATAYRTLLELPPGQLQESCPKSVGIKGCLQEILGNDFLGPLAAALLYPDLAQRFIPLPFLPDRGTAFEKGLEEAFREVGQEDLLNSSLGSLNGKTWAPALFLNSTWSENGRRIVASNLRYGKDDTDEAQIFARSNDQLAELGHDLRLSTAAHNSARFPFVNPPGMWKLDNKIMGRLQDGGLFENYGAETALEILALACTKFACPNAGEEEKMNKPNIKPIVILISSDPSLPRNLSDSPRNKPMRFGYELLTTLTTYEHARTAHGAEAAARLKDWTIKNKGDFYPFRMCKMDSEISGPPLGWALSNKAKETIEGYLHGDKGGDGSKQAECYRDNAEYYKNLIDSLNRTGA